MVPFRRGAVRDVRGRGIIGREVTFRKVRIVTQALINLLHEDCETVERIVVGYDTRVLSEKFAATAAELIASNRIRAGVVPRDVPSPALASAVLERKADAGITFTGSHNPPEYNGLKIYTRDGIGAPSRFTDRVEEHFLALADAWDDVWLPRSSPPWCIRLSKPCPILAQDRIGHWRFVSFVPPAGL